MDLWPARHPLGPPFVTILDPDIIGMPPGYYDVCGISCGGYNPLVPDTAVWLVEDLESTSRLQAVYIGSGGSLAVGYRGLPGTGGGDNLGGSHFVWVESVALYPGDP